MNFSSRISCSIVVLGILSCPRNSSAADYDKQRFDEVAGAIAGDKNKLLDKSLDEVMKMLHLEKVPWDKGYTNYPGGELRIYHFRGFYLTLHLRLLPAGIKPHSKANSSFTFEELEHSGVRWVGAFYPFVRVDQITDSDERMKEYWKARGRAIEERAKRVNPEKQDADKKSRG